LPAKQMTASKRSFITSSSAGNMRRSPEPPKEASWIGKAAALN
jgi:hypothetical protein